MKKISALFGKTGEAFKRLFTLHGAPHDIAMGFALGVFLGIMPGTGPIAALVMAQFLRLNRAAALAGALVTNTWFSLVALGLSAHAGAIIMSVDLIELNHAIGTAFRPFHFGNLSRLSFSHVILPILLGYLIVSIALGIIAYITAYSILRLRHKKN